MGVPDMGFGGVVGVSMMGCVLLGGATLASLGDEETGADGIGAAEAGTFVEGMSAVVVGETRGGGTTMLDFFLAVVSSDIASPTAAASATGR